MEICSLGSNWQYGSIGSENGLAPSKRQAIIWAKVGLAYWRIYASLSLNELNAEIPSAASFSKHAEGWECEKVRIMKRSR